MATIKQKKVISKIIENRGNVSRAMRESGYTEASAKNPKNLTESKGYKEAVSPFVQQMMEERQRLLDSMTTEDLTSVKYKDKTDSVDKLTKNIQLLTGGSTENVAESLTVNFE